MELDELRLILHDDTLSDQFLTINSTAIQLSLRNVPGVGREIGNLRMKTAEGKYFAPPKFTEIAKMIGNNPEQTVVYSSYYENGLKLFADFLDKKGLTNYYKILKPDMAVKTQQTIVEDYNSGKIKILLLHPEIIEGISLKGTQNFHILEPMLNNALLEQLKGRAVRYRSHTISLLEKGM